MQAVVVYDTQFGNTEKVARAIAAQLEHRGDVRLLPLGSAGDLELSGVDLLVIGGPTQGHGARQSLRDWVMEIAPALPPELTVAAFDTRLHWPLLLSGSAARTIARTLQHAGHVRVELLASFLVTGGEGPLVEGELERAAAWADTLLPAAVVPVGHFDAGGLA